MNIIVVGCGRVGSQLATMLSVEGHNVVVIDRDEGSFRRLGGTFNGVTVVGLGFDEEILEEAGIRDADVFAATTNLDNTNLMAAEVARKIFGVEHVVARLYNPVRERTYQLLDLDYVCGTTLVAESLMDKIKSGHGHHVTSINDVELVKFRAGSAADGVRVADLEVEERFRIAAVIHNRVTRIPEPDTVIHEGDIVFGAAKSEALPKIARSLGE